MAMGYDKPLYVLPFDHRATFSKTMFGWPGPLTSEQTAEITAKHLKVAVQIEAALRPGFDAKRLRKILRKVAEKSLMIVGHEPDFTRTIFQLTGGRTKMSKGGVALVELETDSMEGELRWLVPPKVAIA